MKRSLKVVSAALLSVAWSGVLFAGDVTYTFETPPDPLTNPQFTNAFVVGNHSYPSTSDPHWQVWSSGAGAPVGGNPGGYFSISDATNGNNGLAFVFPDIDNGLPLKGFKMDLDVRAGNGTLGRPADGFSISFARYGDPVLVLASNGIYGGFAGGDSLAQAQKSVDQVIADNGANAGDAENGTKTGVAVIFDAWQGNWLPDTPPANAGASTDREGIAVRVDDSTFIQLDLINNRNGADCVPTTQTTLANNGGGLSMQTGTNALVLSGSGCTRVYGGTDASGTYANLVWQPLHVHIVPTTTNTYNLNVTYKGVKVVDTTLPTFNATPGRLVLAGRTGGNNQNCHIDNIHLVTLPATNAVLVSVQGLLNGFKFTISDSGPSILTAVTNSTLDGVNVLPQTMVSYSQTNGQAPLSFGIYTQAVKLVPNSVHTVNLTWLDNFGVNSFGTFTFTVPPWFEFPGSAALPLSAVDQTKPGFLINRYQTIQAQPNQVRWNEEMVAGLHGANIAGPSTNLNTESGAYVWDGPLDFARAAANGNGVFPNDPTSLLTSFGFGAAGTPYNNNNNFYGYPDNCALEIYTYVYFPTSGVYNIVIGSDDGYELTTSGNARDRMGTLIATLNGNNLPTGNTPFSALHPAIVDVPGVYPLRLLYENANGGAGLEFYTAPPFGSTISAGVNAFLLNDTNNTGSGLALKAFRALAAGQNAPPYVSKAVPVRDAMDVFYNQKNVIELSDGTGLTVNSGTVALSVDGVATPVTVTTPGSGITHLVETAVPNRTVGLHTNALTYSDNLGNTYSNWWWYTVMGGANGVAAADPTNTPAMIPLANRVDPGTLSQPGIQYFSYQSLLKQPNVTGNAENLIQGIQGPNIVNVVSVFGTNGFNLNTPADFRFASGTGTGAGGEWMIDNSLRQFGYTEERESSGGNNFDNIALELECWLTFPAAGTFLMNFNSDDGFKASSPNSKNLTDKLGTELGWADVGRGIAGPPGGVPNGGTPFLVNVPAAGAYPFRVVFENGGGDAALEWSIWVPQADGTIIHELVNDPSAPIPILASQVSSVQSGPYVSFANPAANSQGIPWYAPTVVKITDGATLTTDQTRIDSLTEDGVAQTLSASKAGNVTTVVQQLNTPHVYGLRHTNVLVYHDSGGTHYTNQWFYTTFITDNSATANTPATVGAFALVTVPASLTVPTSSLDLTQPGFRIMSYQTTNGQANTVAWTEQQFQGLQGPNIALNANDPPTAGGYWVWTNVIDFTVTPLNGANNSSAEWNYDFALTNDSANYFDPLLSPLYNFANLPPSNFGFVTNPPGTAVQMNNDSLMMGAYLVFKNNGTYIAAISSDDCFKLTVPYGGGYWGIPGLLVGDCNAGRGSAGAGFGPGVNTAVTGFGTRGGMTYCPFVITNAPCAVPMRLIYENGGGGNGVEFSMWMQQSDGSVAYKLVNDPFDPESVQAYQAITTPAQAPYVIYQNLLPALQYGPQRPDYSLSGNSAAATASNNGPVQQDFVFGITNGSTSVNTNLAMHLLYKGVDQPFILTVSNGLLYVTRPANNPQWWPSGALGPLVFNYTDSNGTAQSIMFGNVQTPFWGTIASGAVTLQDQNSPGFKARFYQVQNGLPGLSGQGLNNRILQAEQVLTTLWGTNSINPAHNPTNANVGGYFIFPGNNPSNGVVNFDFAAGSVNGDFNSPVYPETPWPGIPGFGVAETGNDNFVMELLAYVTFPTNGVYNLGVSSDDGFRLIQGWTPPAQNGSVIINSPAALAGVRPGTFDPTLASYFITSPLTGQVAVVKGPVAPANEYGSTNFLGSGFSEDGCIISNPGELAGKIALIFRSTFCANAQKCYNAQQAGAIAVLFVNHSLIFTNGEASPNQLPVEVGVASPPLNIPVYGIEWADGVALREAALTNPPSVVLTPLDNLVNPPPGNNVLGEADFGKGASDVLFPVNVTTAGTYPLRLTYFQGGGGANCEFFSTVNGTNILVNDTVHGSPLKAYYALVTAVTPTISIKNNGNGTITITFTGVLQSKGSVTSNTVWTDVGGSPASPYTVAVPPNAAPTYYRASSGP